MHELWHHANAYTHFEVVEHEPGVEYVVESEENQGKQLSMLL
jgi:hypothetical protein